MPKQIRHGQRKHIGNETGPSHARESPADVERDAGRFN